MRDGEADAPLVINQQLSTVLADKSLNRDSLSGLERRDFDITIGLFRIREDARHFVRKAKSAVLGPEQVAFSHFATAITAFHDSISFCVEPKGWDNANYKRQNHSKTERAALKLPVLCVCKAVKCADFDDFQVKNVNFCVK